MGERDAAGAVAEVVAAVAAGAESGLIIPGGALVVDCFAVLSVEEPSGRALEAAVSSGVPGGASGVRGGDDS